MERRQKRAIGIGTGGTSAILLGLGLAGANQLETPDDRAAMRWAAGMLGGWNLLIALLTQVGTGPAERLASAFTHADLSTDSSRSKAVLDYELKLKAAAEQANRTIRSSGWVDLALGVVLAGLATLVAVGSPDPLFRAVSYDLVAVGIFSMLVGLISVTDVVHPALEDAWERYAADPEVRARLSASTPKPSAPSAIRVVPTVGTRGIGMACVF